MAAMSGADLRTAYERGIVAQDVIGAENPYTPAPPFTRLV